MPGPAKHFDGLDTGETTLPRIGYDPEPPLDIDPSPIDGDDLRAWRKRQYSDTGYCEYPSQGEIAAKMGVSRGAWSRWECSTMPGVWSAIFREWARADQLIEVDPTPLAPGYARAVVAMVGGAAPLADALGTTPQVVHEWTNQSDTGPGRSNAALLRWICRDMGLSPIDELPRRCKGRSGAL
jgi:hypothetical protein